MPTLLSLLLFSACAPDDQGPRPVDCPNLALSEDVLTWPADLATPVTRTLTLTNACGTRGTLTGTASLVSDDFALDAGDQVSFSLIAERSATLDVTFFPSFTDTAEAELVLATNDPDDPVVAVPLVATSGLVDTGETGETGLSDTEWPSDTETDTEPPTDTDAPTDTGESDRYGDVLITEVLFDAAAVSDALGEFIELYNTTDERIDVQGWSITLPSTGSSLTLDQELSIIGNRYAMLSPDDDLDVNGGVDADYVYDRTLLPLPNAGGTLELRDENGLLVSRARVTDGVTSGVAMGLDPWFLTPSAAANPDRWCAQYWQMAGGDYGTPGVENNACEAYEDDDDGDGYTALYDCDDSDADVNPGATEVVLNGKDDDCDGETDVVSLASVTISTLDGDGQDYLAYRNNLATADIDGDGAVELLVGGWFTDQGEGTSDAYVGTVIGLETTSYLSWSGEIYDNDQFDLHGSGQSQFLGGISQHMGDVTGDGEPDIVVAGSDTGTSLGEVALVVYAGGSTRSGSGSEDEAVLQVTDAAGQSRNRALGYADINGDGIAEIVMGEPYTNDSPTYAGRVSLLEGGEWAGTGSLDDADWQLTGNDGGDYLGTVLGGGDLDGDGYAELLVGQPGDDDGGYEAGAMFVLPGGTLSGSDNIENAAQAKWTGGRNDNVGDGGEPCIADFDGDGNTDDVAIAAPDGGTVYIVYDAGLAGDLDLSSDADGIIESRRAAPEFFGVTMACGDIDGDGETDLVVGAPDDDTDQASYYATDAGEVYVFTADVLQGATALDETDSRFTIRAADLLGFGQTLVTIDLDGDGDHEIIANEPNYDTDHGRLYVIDAP